jgi:hypothetical protein
MGYEGAANRPISVALVDDYDVVLAGLAHMFDDHRDRVVVAELDANTTSCSTTPSPSPSRTTSRSPS